MKERKWRKGPLVLLAFGLALTLAAMTVLLRMEDALQYVVPAGNADETQVQTLLEFREQAESQLMDCTSATSVAGIASEVSVSANGSSGSAILYAVGEGWFDVSPVFLTDGRRIDETELHKGKRVAMIDSELAFDLFGSELPEQAVMTIGGEEYEVVGVIRHRRSVGEQSEHCVYIPLASAKEMQMETLMVSSKPIPNSGAHTMFETTVKSGWRSDGNFYSIEKEVMRRLILPRLLLLLFGMSALLAMLRGMNGVAMNRAARFRAGMKIHYFNRMIPQLLGTIAICLVGYGALLALLSALMSFSIQPLYVFTEWIPENIVELSSLKDVFWNLAGTSAQLVKTGTKQMREIEFWGAVLRWGVICMLSGTILMRKKQRR